MPAPILVCFAVPEEARPFRRRLATAAPALRESVDILVTGMGPGPATTALHQYLSQRRTPPRLLITAGFAGALHPQLKVSDVVFDATDAPPFATLLAQHGAKPAHFHTTNHVVTTAAAKHRLHLETGAEVVEMESGALRDLARQRGIPCLLLRTISDPAHEDLPLDFGPLVGPNGHLSPIRLALALLRHPTAIPGLLRLGRRTTLAARNLGEILITALQDASRPPSA
jgi:adenosylhomocysteine nucleosidase